MFRELPVPGGLAGRVEWYRARPTDLLEPTLTYKLELESALCARLGLRLDGSAPGRPARRASPDEMLTAMRARGLSVPNIDDARRLLDELAGLASGATNGTAPPVTEARFRNLVGRGDALLAILGAGPPSAARAPSRPSRPPRAA